MVIATAILHNILIDAGDGEAIDCYQERELHNDAMNELHINAIRTKADLPFAIDKRSRLMESFYEHDNS